MCDEFKEYKTFLEITEVKGFCAHKHSVGEKIEVSITNTSGLCGTFFAAALPWISTFQFGGNIPFSLFAGLDKDTYNLYCPDVVNMVTAKMTREYYKTWDDAEIARIMEEVSKNKKE